MPPLTSKLKIKTAFRHLNSVICYEKSSINYQCKPFQRHTNAHLESSLYVCLHIKTIRGKFRFLILRIIEIFAREVCKFLTEQANLVSRKNPPGKKFPVRGQGQGQGQVWERVGFRVWGTFLRRDFFLEPLKVKPMQI